MPTIIAHRGASGRALENTLEAFGLARALGADGIELDVHATRDHRFAVHHDAAVAGLGPIVGLAWPAVEPVRLANGEPIPLLEEVLATVAGLDVYVEVKQMTDADDLALLALLDAGPTPSRYAIHSFDHAAIDRLTRRRPGLAAGLLTEAPPADPAALLATCSAQALWQRQDGVTRELVSQVHHAGAQVVAWTVNTDGDIRRLVDAGVDGICTDHPDRVRALLGAAA